MDKDKEKETKPNNNSLIITAAVAIVCLVGGFFGGIQYQKSQVPSFDRSQFQNGVRPSGFPARNGNTQGGRPVSGEIVSLEDNTLTIKTQDGGSKIVILSELTNINKTSEATKDDLSEGEQVIVIGTEGSDGTITAQTISIGGNYFQGMPGSQLPENSN